MSEATNSLQGIEFIDEREKLLFAKAKLGSDIVAFLKSDVGRYLHGRAKLEVQEAEGKMLECNLDSRFGRNKAKKLQSQVQNALNFMRYLADMINEGDCSMQDLESYRG